MFVYVVFLILYSLCPWVLFLSLGSLFPYHFSVMCLSPFFSSGSGDKSTAGNHSSLVQWSEVPQHPGIVCALTQTNNAVVLLVRPDVIQIHELKSLPAKSKIQGFVVVRQPTSPGESVSSKVIDIQCY